MDKKKKAIIGVSIGVVAILVVVGMFFLFKKEDVYRLELVGDELITPEVHSEYEEKGYILYLNDEVVEEDTEVVIDNQVDVSKLGTYEVTYTLEKKPELTLIRQVEIVDTTAPVLELKEYTDELVEGDEYTEPGFSSIDNYDGDISKEVVVEGEVDTSKEGEYELIYTSTDSSDNEAEVTRVVTVAKKPEVLLPENQPQSPAVSQSKPNSPTGGFSHSGENGVGSGSSGKAYFSPEKNNNTASNEITRLKFINQGIYIEGVHDQAVNTVVLMDGAGNHTVAQSQEIRGKAYSSTIDLTSVPNGTYTLASPELGNAKLINKFDTDRRIVQAKVGNKLVKVTYPNNNVQLNISNFAYQYDIAINAGHGGNDGGAQGNGQSEQALNLMISLYEKQRYEAHGLKVYINRTSGGSYGEMMGPENWPNIRRSAHKLGEIATVSRYTYSNHHNSTTNNTKYGWEILVNARASKNDLAVEHRVGNAWNGIFRKPMTGLTIYTRNYYTDKVAGKMNGEIYSFTDYYGMQRQTDLLFNEFVPTYEHIYISNPDEVAWYMGGAWKQIAEAKIKEYLNAIGVTYKAP